MGNKDTVKVAVNRAITAVLGEVADYDGTGNKFETDQAYGDTPTLFMTLTHALEDYDIKRFLLEEVMVQLDPTEAATYQLYLLEAKNDDDKESGSDIVFESIAAMADNSRYVFTKNGMSVNGVLTAGGVLPRIVDLEEVNKLYYMLDWSIAPGDTLGYIKVKGRLLK